MYTGIYSDSFHDTCENSNCQSQMIGGVGFDFPRLADEMRVIFFFSLFTIQHAHSVETRLDNASPAPHTDLNGGCASGGLAQSHTN